MKKLMFAVISVLIVISVSMTTSLAQTQETWANYVFGPNHGAQLWSYNPANGQKISFASQFAAYNLSPNNYIIWWGDQTTWPVSGEVFETRTNCNGNNSLLFLKAYRNSSGFDYRVRTVKAEYVDNTTGLVFDITDWCNPNPTQPEGHVYSLWNVYSAPYKLRVWFEIWGYNTDRRGYWEVNYNTGTSVSNPCWPYGAPNPRTSILLRESWWEQPVNAIPNNVSPSTGAWGIGGASSAPYDNAGTPITPTSLWYGRYVHIGKGAGGGWTMAEMDQTGNTLPGSSLCMAYWWLIP